MKFQKKITLTMSLGLLVGALVCAQPEAIAGQDAKQGSASGQQGGAAAPGQAASKPAISPEETQAYQAVVSEASAGLDPDRVISLSEDFAKKYPSSPMLTAVYSFEAAAYRQKGDFQKVVDSSEKSLKLNGDNLMSLITLALI